MNGARSAMDEIKLTRRESIDLLTRLCESQPYSSSRPKLLAEKRDFALWVDKILVLYEEEASKLLQAQRDRAELEFSERYLIAVKAIKAVNSSITSAQINKFLQTNGPGRPLGSGKACLKQAIVEFTLIKLIFKIIFDCAPAEVLLELASSRNFEPPEREEFYVEECLREHVRKNWL